VAQAQPIVAKAGAQPQRDQVGQVVGGDIAVHAQAQLAVFA
jgi:hypothetical protein